MSTVSSFVYVNRIEPGPLSLRVPSGMETRIELSYFDQLGSVINVDLLGQLELTSRSSGGNPVWCAVPATDVVNGRARAILPAYTLDDPNGYQLRLYGTLDQQPILLATGVVDVIHAIGTASIPLDVIDSVELTFQRDEAALLHITVWTDNAGNAEYDLTTTTLSATIYANQGGIVLTPMVVTAIDANEVELSLTAELVNTLPTPCWWSLTAANATGIVTLAEGQVTIYGVEKVPLPATTDSWDYQKPAGEAVPSSGQIIHSGITQNILKISALSQPGTDRVPLLSDLEKNDRITIGATVWTVRTVLYNADGWYEVAISPVAQAAASGVVPVLFEPAL